MLRRIETAEQRVERLKLEAQAKREEAARNEAAIHEAIRRNIQLYGA